MRAVGDESRDLMAIFQRVEVRDMFRISFLANSLVLPVYEDIKREFGLSRGEYLLLLCLANYAELTAQDVADMSGRPRNSISRAVHRMLDDAYITRSPDPSDGRQALLRITDKGRALHESIVVKFVDRERALLGGLDPDEQQLLDGLLDRLVRRAAKLSGSD